MTARPARLVVILGSLLAACGGATPQAPTAPRPASALSPAHWAYAGDEGPARWGDLDPGYSGCKSGVAQSPIDLPSTPARRAPAPDRPTWDPVPLHVVNNGHTIQVDDAAASSFVVEGTRYRLAQFHFHSPSEHSVAGRQYPLEMHLVHKSEQGKLLVVALLFEGGADNAVLAPVWAALPAPGAAAVESPGVTVDVASLLPSRPRYMRYDGSLTTPPCTEGVTWLVVEPEPGREVSPAQVDRLRARTQPTSNRPRQPVGTREVVELLP